MKTSLKLFTFVLGLHISLIGCGHSAGSSGSGDSSTGLSVVVTPASTLLAVGGSTTLTATGGSGTYVNATASEGSIYAVSAGVYSYTAPASTTNSYVSISVTDSAGTIGTVYISLTGTTGATATSATSCGGTYDATIGGIAATLYLVGDAASSVSGYVYMLNYVYPVIGTCTVGGSLALTNLALNQSYTATVSLTGSSQVYLSGAVATTGSTYSWAALSRSTATSVTTLALNCEGTYSATIAGNPGTLVLVEDGSANVAGYLYLQGYYYAMAGTCTGAGGSVSLTNLTTGSVYSGAVSTTGLMSGTFTTSSATYVWSASK